MFCLFAHGYSSTIGIEPDCVLNRVIRVVIKKDYIILNNITGLDIKVRNLRVIRDNHIIG